MKTVIIASCISLSFLFGGGAMAASHKTKISHSKEKVSHNEKKERISINHADAKELQKLPGVGVATADRIVAYREKNGDFKSVQELLKIRGMSANKLQALDKQVGL